MRAVKLNLCSCMPSCHQNGKHCNFTLLFCRAWQGLFHKCVPHVQHAQVTFLTRPIKLFICGAVVAVPVVDALSSLKPGFHIVVSVVRKKFVRYIQLLACFSISLYLSYLSHEQIQLYENLPYKCSIQKKRQIQLVVRDRMNSMEIRLKARFPYLCICRICRVCRTKKIHRTDITLWKPPVQMLNTKETTDKTCCTR